MELDAAKVAAFASGRKSFKTREILDHLKLGRTRANEKAVADQLSTLGFRQKAVWDSDQSKKVYKWQASEF